MARSEHPARWMRLAGAFLVVLWALAGCLPARASLLPRSTPEIVKIGLVAPFEGRYRALGYEALHAVKWALQERNRGRRAGEHAVELVALNDDDEPDRSAFQATKLAVDPDVVGVVGPFSESAWQVAAPVYVENGLPLVAPLGCAQGRGEATGKTLYCLGADPAALADELLSRAGPQSVLMHSGQTVGGLGGVLQDRMVRVYGEPWSWAAIADVMPMGGDTAGDIERVSYASPADALLFDGNAVAAARALVGLRGAGLVAPLWGGPSLGRAQLPQIAGRSAEGACYVVPAPALADLASDSAFAVGYRTLSGVDPGPWAALAYDATRILLEAIDRAVAHEGHASRDGVRAALADARDRTGERLFADGRARALQFAWYCYDGQATYPGRRVDRSAQ